MDNDEALRELWQRQKPSRALTDGLFNRVKRHRRALMAQRGLEVAMTLAAVAVLGWPVWTGDAAPVHWLLIPFFSVFLIVSWTVALSQGLGANPALSENAATFANQRKQQVLRALKNLKLTERSVIALLVYAAAALIGGLLLGDSSWKYSASFLLAYSAACYFFARWLVGRKRRAYWREYRALRRIT